MTHGGHDPAERIGQLDSSRALEGRTGIVTGAAQGLGRECALNLASMGAHVVITGRNRTGLEQTVALAAGLSGSMTAVPADLRSEEQLRTVVSTCAELPGRLHFVVNNAAAQVEKPLDATSNEEWELVQGVNVTAVFWMCKYVLGVLKTQRSSGSIVNIASVAGISADPMLAAYSTSKHAVIGLTRSIAVDRTCTRLGIRANAVSPGDMETQMLLDYLAAHQDPAAARAALAAAYPIERVGTPVEVANVVAFLVSDAASYVNGSALVVDGGLNASIFTSA